MRTLQDKGPIAYIFKMLSSIGFDF